MELATSKWSPWLQHHDWSSDAPSLRHLAITTPWLVNDTLVCSHFKSLHIVDKCVSLLTRITSTSLLTYLISLLFTRYFLSPVSIQLPAGITLHLIAVGIAGEELLCSPHSDLCESEAGRQSGLVGPWPCSSNSVFVVIEFIRKHTAVTNILKSGSRMKMWYGKMHHEHHVRRIGWAKNWPVFTDYNSATVQRTLKWFLPKCSGKTAVVILMDSLHILVN